MKRVLLVSTEPNFYEEAEHLVNRRGVEAYPVMDLSEAGEVLVRVPMDLMILDVTRGGYESAQLFSDLSGLNAQTQLPCILVVPVAQEESMRDQFSSLASVFIVPFPISSKYLFDLSNRLLSVANRKYVRVLVQVRVSGDGGEQAQQTHFAFSRNVSETGLLLESEAAFTIGQFVGINFMLPGVAGGGAIDARAEVVRVQEDEGTSVRYYGLRFEDIADGQQAVIAEYAR
jgi:response regulator RpfG family c-di-GMP phosphodiesterase